ncbi:WD repeat-containing protein 75 [Aricia agestis]|uniref:WD repeat-containing protein 75 n=1 Tax=Aricia agestis TaxID=91739 RepID=UPI001C20A1E9|nr:WD repeat-containing protein 75 [Aricia agestis]
MVEKIIKESNNVNKNNANKFVLNRKAGRSIIERQPVLSPDGESVVVVVENVVRVYNIKTGDCARTLEADSLINELIGVQFADNENYNLYGCSDDGLVITWTYENGVVLRETKLQLPNNLKIMTFDLVDSNECFITAVDSNSGLVYSATFSVKNGNVLYEYLDVIIKFNDIIRVSIGVCMGDKYAAITNGTSHLYIQNLYQPHLRSEIHNYNEFRILNVAAHPKESSVAITDVFGRLTIIRGNLYDYRSVAREALHWHFLPPSAVCFSAQGNYVITGGMEKVLVKWTMSHLANRAAEKTFIPRLPGMIRYVTANNSHIAITLSNNSIAIANAQMHVVTTILECGGLSPVNRALGCSLVYHRSLSALVIPGRSGHLQLFSTSTDKVLYNVDITEMNDIPSEKHNLLPLEIEVTCAAMSANASWLVTSEYRNDGVNYPEERLKFWSTKTQSTSPFKLNTVVNLSHGGCNVVSLALNNKGEFCVSAGTDQKFRVWKKNTTTQNKKKTIAWSCLTACYYSSGVAPFLSSPALNIIKSDKSSLIKDDMPYLRDINYQDNIVQKVFNIHKESLVDERVINRYTYVQDENAMGGVAISHDGSLIAAWFGCKLTLWDSHLCNLRTTLSHPALRPKGISVQFGNNDAAHYLVCTSENCLAVWSLLSLTMKWMVQLKTASLVADPFSNRMAVTTVNNDVYVFTPHLSKPLLVQKKVLDPQGGVIKQCAFATGRDIKLYLMRNNSELYCLQRERTEGGRVEALRRTTPATQFSALLAERTGSNVRAPARGDAHAPVSTHVVTQLLSAAPHMMPPVSALCPLLLEQISGYQQPEEVEEKPGEIMEVDLSSDDEDAPKKETPKTTQLWTPSYERVKEKRLNNIVKDPLLDFSTTSDLFGV